ncbi:hypothetical protein ABPG75_010853 [Micractinium tetrahymenae]
MAGWASLTEELQEVVLLNLTNQERREVSVVCRLWLDIAVRHQRTLVADLGKKKLGIAQLGALLAGARRRSLNIQRACVTLSRWHGDDEVTTLALLLRELPRLTDLFTLALVLPALTALTLSTPLDFPGWLDHLPALNSLHLSLGWDSEFYLPTSLSALRQLSLLDVDGMEACSLAEGRPPAAQSAHLSGLRVLAALPALRDVCLFAVCFSDLDWLPVCALGLSFMELPALPASVAKMPLLQRLELEHNRMESLPAGPYQRSLTSLHVGHCASLAAG